MKPLEYIEFETKTPAKACVIWLHGLGADGYDFQPVVPALELDDDVGIKFVFPHAPHMSVTINNGAIMPAWYDISGLDKTAKIDLTGIRQSVQQIYHIIHKVNSTGIPFSKIIIAGFSQGGLIATEAALSFHRPLAGLLSISSYFPTPQWTLIKNCNRNLSALVCHGTHDDMVNHNLGKKTYESLTRIGCDAEFKTYSTGHNVIKEELVDIGTWMCKTLITR